MKTLRKYFRTLQSDSGSSLIEVIVASVIMSILGLSLVMVTVGAKPLADRFNAKSVALSSLTFASNQIQNQAIAPISCSFDTTSAKNVVHSAGDQPYEFGNDTLGNGRYGFIVSTIEDFSPAISNGSTGFTYSISPAILPAGLSVSSNGLIIGTPTTESSSNYTLTATKGTTVLKSKINITVIKVVVMIDASLSSGSVNFQSCPDNNIGSTNTGITAAIAAAGSTQTIQQIQLTTISGTTSTTRTIVKLG